MDASSDQVHEGIGHPRVAQVGHFDDQRRAGLSERFLSTRQYVESSRPVGENGIHDEIDGLVPLGRLRLRSMGTEAFDVVPPFQFDHQVHPFAAKTVANAHASDNYRCVVEDEKLGVVEKLSVDVQGDIRVVDHPLGKRIWVLLFDRPSATICEEEKFHVESFHWPEVFVEEAVPVRVEVFVDCSDPVLADGDLDATVRCIEDAPRHEVAGFVVAPHETLHLDAAFRASDVLQNPVEGLSSIFQDSNGRLTGCCVFDHNPHRVDCSFSSLVSTKQARGFFGFVVADWCFVQVVIASSIVWTHKTDARLRRI